VVLPFEFSRADELLAICEREKLSIAQVGFANELARHEGRDGVVAA
jgi:L-serine deaminase